MDAEWIDNSRCILSKRHVVSDLTFIDVNEDGTINVDTDYERFDELD